MRVTTAAGQRRVGHDRGYISAMPTRELPSGLVTFMLTDIEGSTRMIRSDPDGYAVALADHQQVIAEVADGHDGVVVSHSGDAHFLAFADSAAATVCASSIHRALDHGRRSAVFVPKVRIGLHTGVGAPRNGDYVSLAVHRTARVMAVGHGGQTVATTETVEASAEAREAAGLRATSLGRYTLRDFDEPVELFQINGGEFPPLRAVPAERHNIALPNSELIGRGPELAELHRVVAPGAVVTLVGTGGVGKTRLACHFAVETVDRWADGARFVDLSTINDPKLVLAAVNTELRVDESSAESSAAALIEHLRRRRMLVVLDNAEHVRDGVIPLAEHVRRAALGTCLLVTSRQRLAVLDETVIHVGPLGTAATADGQLNDAARLYCQRALAGDRSWMLEPGEEQAVEALCERVDRLPLAIEMVASRATAFRPEEMLRLLKRSDAMLAAPASGADRHATIERVVEWSERTLTGPAATCLHVLSLCPAPVSLDEASVLVDGDVASDDVPEAVWSLVERSLLHAEHSSGHTRYRMLHTVRSYARARLDDAQALAAANRFGTWLLGQIGPGTAIDHHWLSVLDDTVDNARAILPLIALSYPSSAARLAWSIATYLDLRHRTRHGMDEARHWAAELSAAGSDRVALSTLAADLALRTGDLQLAELLLAEATQIANEHGATTWDPVGIQRTNAEVALRRGDSHAALDALAAIDLGSLDAIARGRVLSQRAVAEAEAGKWTSAADTARAEADAWRDAGHLAFEASALGNVAEAELRRGDTVAAATAQLGSLELALGLGLDELIAFSGMVAAHVAEHHDRRGDAFVLMSTALDVLAEREVQLYESDRQRSLELLHRCRSDAAGTDTALDVLTLARRARDVLEGAISGESRTGQETAHERADR